MRYKQLIRKVITATLGATIALTSLSLGQASELTPTASAAVTQTKGQKVAKYAAQYIGRVQYKWGVNNPQYLIFDCGSFTKFIYAKVGVKLKWGNQKSQGYRIKKANLRVGDLVFFDTIGANNGKINHVGIYVGNGQMIHNNPKGVSKVSIRTGYWSKHYVMGRRVL